MITHLNAPLELPCGVILENRFAKAAMTEGLADEMNRATPRLETLYRRWAQGGAALHISGNVHVDRRYLERPGNVAIDGNGGLDALGKVAQAATSNGGQFWIVDRRAKRPPLWG